jgi:hypothetical protein
MGLKSTQLQSVFENPNTILKSKQRKLWVHVISPVVYIYTAKELDLCSDSDIHGTVTNESYISEEI